MGIETPFSASRYAVGATDQVEACARILSTFRPVWDPNGIQPLSCRGLFSASTRRVSGRKSLRLASASFLHRPGVAEDFIVQAAGAMGHAVRMFLPALDGSRSNRGRHMESREGRVRTVTAD